MKQFISTADVPSVPRLVDIALNYKKDPFRDKELGKNKTVGMIFLNPSLRTRLSTQIAAKNLGMEPIVFNIDKEGWALEMNDGVVMNGNTTEHVKEAAAVMGQYFDILAIRTFPGLKNKEEDYTEKYINQFIKYAGVPVVSLESATLHPLQSLTDVITIKENWQQARKPKVVMTWAPHVKALPQAVPNSFAQWMNAWGEADFVITHPEGYELDEKFSGNAQIEYDQDKALQDADFVYVKNWSSYKDYGKITCTDPSWMFTNEKLKLTNAAKVMHCLPVRRNVVIADEVLDGPQSIVIREAGNRVWAAQAVLSEILKG
ncbi:N-succinyl-L-ornithine transcarbamylase [Chitinophaga ginsengisegetis]|uniref:N-succinylornithine carbamoyltransferase n=1 Tax=Chitinophaga ginsengisegetis TaxID=393003 RepID=A0A1T5NJH4_9BACT|nr:N-acetylornithine carbamoyltransferase [Chitinophaga ginsengisegetis]MDR6569717.1 N-succinyl-L-ornithine transcarbamylase [Chitinophaga ginsengisegetis]MDR6649450.1 N-succinyl-L-ornithine transcarbamylase [Chitinophaga ginsengisegetis]MDR6655800.1 N-succinyl-L-ornithine transcarbamylase [Chitinophaga ginsengisegetis]SKD00229.1 N-succinyl-L-ornithine transcarbamylase [Chitinophaga ginsengisegetis]